MNNRQAGRRRGRGGQQRQGGNPGQQGNGNRIDNRARGNAAQLLEKYKNLARDAQMQGDRVNTEYYLQFADHYFRVLSETRSRFEEQNQQRRQRDDFDGDDEEFEAEADGNRAEEAEGPPQPRREREDRRNGYTNGHANGYAVEAEAESGEHVEERAPREERGARRRGRPRREEAAADAAESHAIDVAVLPPAFGIDSAPAEVTEEPAKKPRRRRTRSEDTEAPVA